MSGWTAHAVSAGPHYLASHRIYPSESAHTLQILAANGRQSLTSIHSDTLLVPLHSDFDRLTVPWFQCGQVGPINQDSDTPRHLRAP